MPSSGGCKWSDPVVSDIISQPRPLLIVRTSGAGDRQFWGLIMVFNVKSACLPKLSKSAVVSCIISQPRPQWNMGTRGGHQWESPTQGVIITVGRVSPLSALSGVTLPSMTHDHVNTGDTCPNVSSSLNGKWLGQQSGNTPIWRMLGEWKLKRNKPKQRLSWAPDRTQHKVTKKRTRVLITKLNISMRYYCTYDLFHNQVQSIIMHWVFMFLYSENPDSWVFMFLCIQRILIPTDHCSLLIQQ